MDRLPRLLAMQSRQARRPAATMECVSSMTLSPARLDSPPRTCVPDRRRLRKGLARYAFCGGGADPGLTTRIAAPGQRPRLQLIGKRSSGYAGLCAITEAPIRHRRAGAGKAVSSHRTPKHEASSYCACSRCTAGRHGGLPLRIPSRNGGNGLRK